MKIFRCLLIALTATLATACSVSRTHEPALYDFGPPATVPHAELPAVSVADVNAPVWLESTGMIYRLSYANRQQMHSYAQSRWAMAPARLLEQRLKHNLTQAGGKVAAAVDNAADLPVLRLELEDFSQSFDSPTQSASIITIRATLWKGRNLNAQKTFSRTVPAPTPDAPGGAAAMAIASDSVIADIGQWLVAQTTR